MGRVFVGHDWAEAHHDVCILDGEGRCLANSRLPDGLEGVAGFHALVGEFIEEPAAVTVATETDRGLFIAALVAAGYLVLAVNPLSTSRYRERYSTSGAKSDSGDARVLAELARTDAHKHRPVAGDSDLGEAVRVLARAHHSMIWTRGRHTNQLRSTLREFYPAALEAFDDLDSADAVSVLAVAPPHNSRRLTTTKVGCLGGSSPARVGLSAGRRPVIVPSTKEDGMGRAGRAVAWWALVAMLLGLAGCGGDASPVTATIETVSPVEAADLVAEAPEGLVILDVRTPGEFAEGHLARAVNLDYQAAGFADELAALDREVPYLMYCRSGNRSASVREMMRDLGFAEVYEIGGGISAWVQAGQGVVAP